MLVILLHIHVVTGTQEVLGGAVELEVLLLGGFGGVVVFVVLFVGGTVELLLVSGGFVELFVIGGLVELVVPLMISVLFVSNVILVVLVLLAKS